MFVSIRNRAASGGRSHPGRLVLLFALAGVCTLGALGTLGTLGTASASEPAWARGDARSAPEPGPVRRSPDAPPWPKDFEVGLEAAREFAHNYGLVQDDTLLQRIERVGYRVASQTGRPDILFTFHVVDVPEPNALALPGGFVFITKGMTDLHLPDNALAFLLGHEIAHVVQNHFARAGRVNGVVSLLQTAVTVAALLAVPASTSGGYDRDLETGQYRTSLAGRDAAVEGSQIFGSVFKELLLRGYSRSLEMEADEVGRRFAGRAGYSMSGSVQLLEDLHQRVYEDQEFGYWQTHPYFTDRLGRAEAAVDAGGTAPSEQEVRAYREQIQQKLTAIAASVEDEPTAMFLYRSAVEAGPGGEPGFEIEHQLLKLRATRLRKRTPVLRAYGPLVADYDSLLVRMKKTSVSADILKRVQSDRDDLDQERRELYEPSIAILDREQAATPFLELFLENFPDDPRAAKVRLRLADQYRNSDRPDAAALILAGLDFDEDDSTHTFHLPALPESARKEWNLRSIQELRQVLPQTKELTTSQRILLATRSDSVRTWAIDELKAQADSLDSLEVGSRFLRAYPVSYVSNQVRDKVDALAMKRYYRARLAESLHDFQNALDGYNEIILLARETKAAGMAREGVERIQALANNR